DPTLIHDMLLDGVIGRTGKDPDEVRAMLEATAPIDRILEVMLRAGVRGDHFGDVADGLTFSELRDHPHGIDYGPLMPRVPEVRRTPSGAIELVPDPIAADLARAADALDAELEREPSSFLLVGRRHLRSNNSWLHNVNVLVKGKERCTLQVHPDD